MQRYEILSFTILTAFYQTISTEISFCRAQTSNICVLAVLLEKHI